MTQWDSKWFDISLQNMRYCALCPYTEKPSKVTTNWRNLSNPILHHWEESRRVESSPMFYFVWNLGNPFFWRRRLLAKVHCTASCVAFRIHKFLIWLPKFHFADVGICLNLLNFSFVDSRGLVGESSSNAWEIQFLYIVFWLMYMYDKVVITTDHN